MALSRLGNQTETMVMAVRAAMPAPMPWMRRMRHMRKRLVGPVRKRAPETAMMTRPQNRTHFPPNLALSPPAMPAKTPQVREQMDAARDRPPSAMPVLEMMSVWSAEMI